jgi:hypothetical protein
MCKVPVAVRLLWLTALLAGVEAAGAGVTVALLPGKVAAASAPAYAPAAKPSALFTLALRPATAKLARPRPVPKARRTRAAARQPRPVSPPRATASLYERTTAPSILREQGCRAGRQRTSGLVVLDFGKPAFRRHTYGTVSFSGRFASNTSITWAMKSYARGYVECLPERAGARIVLVRGTSNYRPEVPSAFVAGRHWARQTVALDRYLHVHHFDDRVDAAAGDDAEPEWDRAFRQTYDFFRGFRSAAHGVLLYDYGSLDGGPGGIWNVRQAYFVAAGMRLARAVPEIYNRAMAEEWAYLSRLSAERYGKPLEFAGVMSQHRNRCRRCGFTAAQAHTALVRELARSPRTRVRALAAVTNIGVPAPPRGRRES